VTTCVLCSLCLQVPNDEEEQCGIHKVDEASTPRSSFSSRTNHSESSDEFQKMSDEFEPVDIEGSEKPDVWVHRPGSDVTSAWEPRKGRPRCQDSKIHRENDACSDSPRSSVSESHRSDSGTEEATSSKLHVPPPPQGQEGFGQASWSSAPPEPKERE